MPLQYWYLIINQFVLAVTVNLLTPETEAADSDSASRAVTAINSVSWFITTIYILSMDCVVGASRRFKVGLLTYWVINYLISLIVQRMRTDHNHGEFCFAIVCSSLQFLFINSEMTLMIFTIKLLIQVIRRENGLMIL